ncbi:hypothetical protein AWY96_23210 [Serratia plymuthica]|nr:hypothetical protein AWY96_23210 [Serratia plymuthica]
MTNEGPYAMPLWDSKVVFWLRVETAAHHKTACNCNRSDVLRQQLAPGGRRKCRFENTGPTKRVCFKGGRVQYKKVKMSEKE